jgi:hypothetical protein
MDLRLDLGRTNLQMLNDCTTCYQISLESGYSSNQTLIKSLI